MASRLRGRTNYPAQLSNNRLEKELDIGLDHADNIVDRSFNRRRQNYHHRERKRGIMARKNKSPPKLEKSSTMDQSDSDNGKDASKSATDCDVDNERCCGGAMTPINTSMTLESAFLESAFVAAQPVIALTVADRWSPISFQTNSRNGRSSSFRIDPSKS